MGQPCLGHTGVRQMIGVIEYRQQASSSVVDVPSSFRKRFCLMYNRGYCRPDGRGQQRFEYT